MYDFKCFLYPLATSFEELQNHEIIHIEEGV